MLLYACGAPGVWQESADSHIWNCDSDADSAPADLPFGLTCAPHAQASLLFRAARDAPVIQPPAGTGFQVGGETGLSFLVLRIHQDGVAGAARSANRSSIPTARAGFRVTIVDAETAAERQLRRVALGVIGAHGELPPHATSHLEAAFKFKVPGLVMQPLAFLVHTHERGRAVTAWRVTPDGEWTLIAQRDPQEPETFAPMVTPDVRIREGDLIAVRCTLYNPLDRVLLAR